MSLDTLEHQLNLILQFSRLDSNIESKSSNNTYTTFVMNIENTSYVMSFKVSINIVKYVINYVYKIIQFKYLNILNSFNILFILNKWIIQ